MPDAFVAVVVSLPKEYFPDGDDLCWVAGRHICARLESYLAARGHSVSDVFRGGREEEWGVSFESHLGSETFRYDIYSFPGLGAAPDGYFEIVIEYRVEASEPRHIRRILKKPEFQRLPVEHGLHETMREFGSCFASSQMLTHTQLGDVFGIS